MEPMNATALYTADRCEVWGPTQNGEAAFAAAAEAAGLPAAKCDVHNVHLGGGFGRRGMTDYVSQAVLIAKQMPGTPVKLLWSREEDMAHGRYHPVMQARLTGGLDASGNLAGLHMRLSGQSILASVRPEALDKGKDILTFQGVFESGEHSLEYTVPNLLIDHAMRNTHVPPGFWRGVNINQNAMFIECFMDELAEAAGQDPLEFRRKLMAEHPKSLGVLNAVAEKGGWSKPAPAGRYRGLAQMKAFDSFVAAALRDLGQGRQQGQGAPHRRRDRPGLRREPGADRAPDRGLVRLRPVRAVLPGVHGEGRAHRAVELPRLQLDAHRADAEGRDHPDAHGRPFWGGIGEPTICVAAPAVLNAYAKATGKRIRSVPLKNHGIELV